MRVSSCFFKRSYTLTTVAFPSILPSPLSLPSTGMSESETPNPIPQDPAAVSSELSDDSIQPDPLLGSGSFIDPDRNESRPESPEHQQTEVDRTVEFGLDTVIDAKPISMLAPADNFAEAVPRPPMRRNPEEMAKKPSWLPDDWKIELRVRSSGATAGTIDRLQFASPFNLQIPLFTCQEHDVGHIVSGDCSSHSTLKHLTVIDLNVMPEEEQMFYPYPTVRLLETSSQT